MGILIGKVAHETMIVMDSFPLPVQGTETRVNAQVIFFVRSAPSAEVVSYQITFSLYNIHLIER